MRTEQEVLEQIKRLGCVIQYNDFYILEFKKLDLEGYTTTFQLFKKDKQLCVTTGRSFYSYIDYEILKLATELFEIMGVVETNGNNNNKTSMD